MTPPAIIAGGVFISGHDNMRIRTRSTRTQTAPHESERRRLGFPTRRLPDQFAWPTAASPEGWAPSTASRCVTGVRLRLLEDLIPSPECGLATVPVPLFQSHDAASLQIRDPFRSGSAGHPARPDLHPTHRRGSQKNQSRALDFALAELGWPFAVMRCLRTGASDESPNSGVWDEWG